MIVHFIASKSNLADEYENLKLITDTVTDLGHDFARNWLDTEYASVNKKYPREGIDWRKITNENLEALSRADIVIAEASAKSFSVGYQVATALHQKKPVLILSHNNALFDSFESGVASDFVRIETYNKDTVRDIITDFINENNIDNKELRFNFFIDRQIYNYLRWAAYRTGKNKSEILRELINREIAKKED